MKKKKGRGNKVHRSWTGRKNRVYKGRGEESRSGRVFQFKRELETRGHHSETKSLSPSVSQATRKGALGREIQVRNLGRGKTDKEESQVGGRTVQVGYEGV